MYANLGQYPTAQSYLGQALDIRREIDNTRGEADTMTYLVAGPGGVMLAATDEARVIRDHAGALHRVGGIPQISYIA